MYAEPVGEIDAHDRCEPCNQREYANQHVPSIPDGVLIYPVGARSAEVVFMTIVGLWLPIVVSATVAFIAGAVIWMGMPWHSDNFV